MVPSDLVNVTAVEAGGKDFIDAILASEYHTDRENENFVYIQAYDRKQGKGRTELR